MKSKKQLKEEFLFSTPTMAGDVSFIEIAQGNNLHRFSTELSYIDAFVSGGKLSPKEAAKRVKDLYKVWKSSNQSLEDSWS